MAEISTVPAKVLDLPFKGSDWSPLNDAVYSDASSTSPAVATVVGSDPERQSAGSGFDNGNDRDPICVVGLGNASMNLDALYSSE